MLLGFLFAYEVPMPYTATTVPDAVKDLPEAAQKIWLGAYNAVFAKFKGLDADTREAKAAAIAWSAVKKQFAKGDDDEWHPKSDDDMAAAEIDALIQLAEYAEPELDIVATNATQLVTLHALAEADVAEGSGERISTVEVAQVGSYVDAHGKSVDITEASIDRMVANFEAQAAGQAVPVDVMHEKREATGWLKRVWRDGSKLLAEVSWNNMGTRLVSDKIYRYLSASIAMPTWVLRSVSLVNFPAIKGLAPVELSEWLLSQAPSQVIPTISQDASRRPHADKHIVLTASPAKAGANSNGGSKMAENETSLHEGAAPEVVPAAEPNTQLAEFQAALEAGKDKIITEMMERITAELATKRTEMLAQLSEQMQDERELSEFALSATATGAHALPVKPDELTAFLRELPKSQRTQAMDLFRKIQQGGTVDMRELGTSAEGQDKRQLDADVAGILQSQMRNGMTVAKFFQANPDLGDMGQYDLSAFGK